MTDKIRLKTVNCDMECRIFLSISGVNQNKKEISNVDADGFGLF
jgi:hypothetical protein